MALVASARPFRISVNENEVPQTDVERAVDEEVAHDHDVRVAVDDGADPAALTEAVSHFRRLCLVDAGEVSEIHQRLMDLASLGFIEIADRFYARHYITKKTIGVDIDLIVTSIVTIAASFVTHGLSLGAVKAFQSACRVVGSAAKKKISNLLEYGYDETTVTHSRMEASVRLKSFVFAFVTRIELVDRSRSITVGVASSEDQMDKIEFLSAGLHITQLCEKSDLVNAAEDELDRIDSSDLNRMQRRTNLKQTRRMLESLRKRKTSAKKESQHDADEKNGPCAPSPH